MLHMARGREVHPARIVAEAELPHNIELFLVQSEAWRSIAADLRVKGRLKLLLARERCAAEVLVVHAARRHMLQPVQREAVAPVDIALHPLPLAQSRPADGEHRRANLILFQQADIDIQPVQHVPPHPLPGLCHALRVGKILDIDRENGVFLSLHFPARCIPDWQALPAGSLYCNACAGGSQPAGPQAARKADEPGRNPAGFV